MRKKPFKKTKKRAAKKPPLPRWKAIKMSKNEARIAKFLRANGVSYKREHCFPDMTAGGKPVKLYFDFYLSQYNLCIEFDGLHHYQELYPNNPLYRVKANDRKKNNYCKRKNIHLLRIPYFESQNIEKLICEAIDFICPV